MTHPVDWKLALAVGGGGLVAAALLAYAFFRPKEHPDSIERKRRLYLNQIGRIAEGQVVEFVVQSEDYSASHHKNTNSRKNSALDQRSRQLVSYSYAISGVTYHTAQDVTGLESQIRFERLVAGHPASVKYDPHNPSDSILVADDWSGLR